MSLSGTARGAYLQLIVAAKDQRDDGTVCYRSVAAAGSDWGLDRRTASKVLTILQQKCLLSYTENGSGVITIQLPNYKEWQEIDVDGVRQKRRKNVTKIPSLRPDQSKAEQSRAKQTISIPFSEIIDHLNITTGSDYKSTPQKTQDLIKARWNEGFRLEDFKIVHIKKAGEWLNTDMAKYLRPITLYSPKFEGYLNQIPDDNRFSNTTKHNIQVLTEWLNEKKEQINE